MYTSDHFIYKVIRISNMDNVLFSVTYPWSNEVLRVYKNDMSSLKKIPRKICNTRLKPLGIVWRPQNITLYKFRKATYKADN